MKSVRFIVYYIINCEQGDPYFRQLSSGLPSLYPGLLRDNRIITR